MASIETINCSYKTLVEIFGPPTYGPSGDDKSFATWDFDLDIGWGEIYDYKSGESCVEDVIYWRVRADNADVDEWLKERLYGVGELEGSSADS